MMPSARVELCEFSNLPKQSCSHCKRHKRRQYELRESSYYGNEIVEVLKDGGPIHSHDEHFRFGVEKAVLMLASIAMVKQFLELGDAAAEVLAPQVIETPGGDIQVSVE